MQRSVELRGALRVPPTRLAWREARRCGPGVPYGCRRAKAMVADRSYCDCRPYPSVAVASQSRFTAKAAFVHPPRSTDAGWLKEPGVDGGARLSGGELVLPPSAATTPDNPRAMLIPH